MTAQAWNEVATILATEYRMIFAKLRESDTQQAAQAAAGGEYIPDELLMLAEFLLFRLHDCEDIGINLCAIETYFFDRRDDLRRLASIWNGLCGWQCPEFGYHFRKAFNMACRRAGLFPPFRFPEEQKKRV